MTPKVSADDKALGKAAIEGVQDAVGRGLRRRARRDRSLGHHTPIIDDSETPRYIVVDARPKQTEAPIGSSKPFCTARAVALTRAGEASSDDDWNGE